MATFSPTEAALEGFRIVRERPRAMLVWAVANLVISLVIGIALIAIFGERLAELEAAGAAAGDDPAQAAAVFEQLGPLYTFLLPIGLVVMAVFNAAAFRIVLRPGDDRFGYLRLGKDELRLIALTLIYFVLAIGATFVVTLVAALLSEGATAVGGGAGRLLAVLIWLAAVGLLVFAGVRMSLAGPMTFAEGRLRVFESWTLSRGNFWRLLGAYVLAVVLVVVVFLLALIIYVAVAAVVAGGDLATAGQMVQPNPQSIGAFFTPAMAIYLVFVALFSAFQNAVLYAPPAVAYRELSKSAA